MGRSSTRIGVIWSFITGSGAWSSRVPRGLHKSLGTKLTEPLRTDSRAVANRLKGPIVAKLKALITERDDAGGRSAFI